MKKKYDSRAANNQHKRREEKNDAFSIFDIHKQDAQDIPFVVYSMTPSTLMQIKKFLFCFKWIFSDGMKTPILKKINTFPGVVAPSSV